MKMEKALECSYFKGEKALGVGFWIEGFGTVDMYYVPDDDENVVLSDSTKHNVKDAALRSMDRLFKTIDCAGN